MFVIQSRWNSHSVHMFVLRLMPFIMFIKLILFDFLKIRLIRKVLLLVLRLISVSKM